MRWGAMLPRAVRSVQLLPCMVERRALSTGARFGGGDGYALAAAEMPRINCLRAPGPAETAHGYPLHGATSRRGKRPTRSKYAAGTSTGPQGPPQRGHARGRARGPVHADPDLPWVRLHLVDNAAEQLHPGEGMQLKVQVVSVQTVGSGR